MASEQSHEEKTSNAKETSNTQHPTSNIQWRKRAAEDALGVGSWMLDVGCFIPARRRSPQYPSLHR
jgi:hypothetical protein